MVGLAGLLVVLAVPFLPITAPGIPELELSTQEAAPGEEVDVDGRGFEGCLEAETTDAPPSEGFVTDPDPDRPASPTQVTLRWVSEGEDPRPLGETTLDRDGAFSTTITVPADAGAEAFYLVSASCRRGPGFDEIGESAYISVVAPPVPPTSDPPSTSDPPPTGQVVTTPTSAPPAIPTTEGGGGTAAPEVPSTGSDVLPAAFVSVVLLGLGLLGLTRAVRIRTRRRPRGPSVSAVAAPAPPGLLDVRPLGPERTVALRVALRVDPGVLTVHRSKE